MNETDILHLVLILSFFVHLGLFKYHFGSYHTKHPCNVIIRFIKITVLLFSKSLFLLKKTNLKQRDLYTFFFYHRRNHRVFMLLSFPKLLIFKSHLDLSAISAEVIVVQMHDTWQFCLLFFSFLFYDQRNHRVFMLLSFPELGLKFKSHVDLSAISRSSSSSNAWHLIV